MLNLHEPHGQFGIPDLWQFSDTLTPVWACRVVRDTRVQRSVDRNLFRSSRGARHSQECSTLSNRFNLCENCYKSSSEQVNCGSAVGYPLPYLFTPGVTHAPGCAGVPPASRLRGQAALAPRRKVHTSCRCCACRCADGVPVHTWGDTRAWVRGRPARVASPRASCPRSQEKGAHVLSLLRLPMC